MYKRAREGKGGEEENGLADDKCTLAN